MFGEMHPPDLKMLETNSGVRGSGGSFGGKAQASSSNTTECTLQVEAVEASFGLNSQTAERVQGSKDKDSGADVDAVCRVNPASAEKKKICALGTVVENGCKKWAHVEAAEDVVCRVNPDNMHQQNSSGENKRGDVEDEDEDEDEDDEDYDYNEDEDDDEDEDEDDGGNEDKDDVGNEDTKEDDEDYDYDYNGWHEFVGNGCERDEDDDFDGCPPKGGRGVRSSRNDYERSGVTKVRSQGSGRGQLSRATGRFSSSKQHCNMRHYEDNTDQVRDFVCTSRMVDFPYTKDSDIGGSVDVVHVTPPKDRN
ncbi:hypothetical protein HID58_025297 [Brassica napus]|uniref:Uncharacterized protein n=1 Tax=Brassica napus TaxID=3708 RepID=A0ABQ8CKQ0_BRANA|nr:hypothetical protein HID58_025297 [Brassica napus]